MLIGSHARRCDLDAVTTWQKITVGNILWHRHDKTKEDKSRHPFVVVGLESEEKILLAKVTSQILHYGRDQFAVFIDHRDHQAINRPSAVIVYELKEILVGRFFDELNTPDPFLDDSMMIEINTQALLPTNVTRTILNYIIESDMAPNKFIPTIKRSLAMPLPNLM